LLKIQLIKNIDALLGRCFSRLLLQPRVDSSGTPGRILLIRPGGIGDAILLIPAISLLKLQYPEAQIDILAEKRNAGAFRLCGHESSIYRYDVFSEFRQVLCKRYDVIIDTEQWYRLSAVVARLIRSDMKIGFATNERRRMLTHGVDYSHEIYEADNFLSLLQPLGIAPVWERDRPFLDIAEADRDSVAELLAVISGPFVVIFPGASITERRWSPERFAAVASRLQEQGVVIVVVGGVEDRSAGEQITAACSGLNLAGRTTLAQTAAVLERASLLISGDSGVLHMGVASGVSTVSLFGPGIQQKWGPRGERHRVINHHLPCSPCTRFGNTPSCPYGGRCIQEIEPDEVVAAAFELL
jgi:ADP-heptose:LPS heptosyltransferase